MTSVDTGSPAGASDRTRRIGAALALVRYCGWLSDPKFDPWHLEARDLMSRALMLATDVVQDADVEDSTVELLRRQAENWLEEFDPDSGPFGTKLFQHINLVREAVVVISEPQRQVPLDNCYRRTSQMADAAKLRGQNYYQGNWNFFDFEEGEKAARLVDSTDRDRAASLSREFASRYADVMANSFVDAR